MWRSNRSEQHEASAGQGNTLDEQAHQKTTSAAPSDPSPGDPTAHELHDDVPNYDIKIRWPATLYGIRVKFYTKGDAQAAFEAVQAGKLLNLHCKVQPYLEYDKKSLYLWNPNRSLPVTNVRAAIPSASPVEEVDIHTLGAQTQVDVIKREIKGHRTSNYVYDQHSNEMSLLLALDQNGKIDKVVSTLRDKFTRLPPQIWSQNIVVEKLR